MKNVLDLFQGRCSLFPLGGRNPSVLVGQIEILGIGVLKARFVPRLRLEDVMGLLGQLPESQREVILMLKVSGMSLEEIARATSSSVGAIKQKAHRAYARCRISTSGRSNPILPQSVTRAVPSVAQRPFRHRNRFPCLVPATPG